MRLFCHFFFFILWKGNVERLYINRPYYQCLGRLCSSRYKGGGGGGGAVEGERKEGGKKKRGGDPLFSFLHSAPPPLTPATQASVWYDHEKFKMFNARIVSYRVHRFVFMSALNSHWLDEREKGKVITCNLLSIAVNGRVFHSETIEFN